MIRKFIITIRKIITKSMIRRIINTIEGHLDEDVVDGVEEEAGVVVDEEEEEEATTTTITIKIGGIPKRIGAPHNNRSSSNNRLKRKQLRPLLRHRNRPRLHRHLLHLRRRRPIRMQLF